MVARVVVRIKRAFVVYVLRGIWVGDGGVSVCIEGVDWMEGSGMDELVRSRGFMIVDKTT